MGSADAAAPARRADISALSSRDAPAWARDGVIYEINTRTFSATGDFDGITARLGELSALGVTVVWLMPIHPIGEERRKGRLGSPYAVRDYFAVNPDYGTDDTFRRLVETAHGVGLRVIIDIVANHTAWDSTMVATPAFYRRDENGGLFSPADWSDVIVLNYTVQALRRHMIAMMQYWLREFDVDGFRCDVAGLVPTDFWEEARPALEEVKADILLLAEWHEPELLVKAFDLDYSWPTFRAVAGTIVDGAPASRIRAEWEAERDTFPRGALHLRFSDNHDEQRATVRFGERGALAASAIMFTLDGVPLLYNGMEVGDEAESRGPALFDRLPIDWGIAERRPAFGAFYRRIIALRRSHDALSRGETIWLHNSDESRVVTFLRRGDAEEFLVAVNLSDAPFAGTVDSIVGSFVEVVIDADAARASALPEMELDAWGYRLFQKTR